MQRFEVRKDLFFQSLFWTFCGIIFVAFLLNILAIYQTIFEKTGDALGRPVLYALLLGGQLFFLFRIFRSPHYVLTDVQLIYAVGWSRGSIPLAQVHWVKEGTYPAAGRRPALAWHGLVIGYGEGYELFVSPVEQKKFKQQLEAGMQRT